MVVQDSAERWKAKCDMAFSGDFVKSVIALLSGSATLALQPSLASRVLLIIFRRLLGSGSIVGLYTRSPRRAVALISIEPLILDPRLGFSASYWRLVRSLAASLNLAELPVVDPLELDPLVRRLSRATINPFAALRIENYLTQLGFFLLAHQMRQERFNDFVGVLGTKHLSAKKLLLGIFVFIWRGDRESALSLLGRLRETTRYRLNRNQLNELEWYLDTWQSGEKRNQGQLQFAELQPITNLVAYKSVLVMGPGETSSSKNTSVPHHQVALMSAKNGLGTNPCEGLGDVEASTKILYWVPAREQKSREALTDVQMAFLRSFDLNVQLNSSCIGIEDSLRSQVRMMETWGLANKAQAMIFDALKSGAHSVFVTGVDSFTGKTKYASKLSRDWLPDSLKGIKELELAHWDVAEAYMFALHDGVFNRRLLANLLDAGVIGGDEQFQFSCKLSDQEYLERINQKFGRKNGLR